MSSESLLDEQLVQQLQLIRMMDAHYQKQLESLHDRINKAKGKTKQIVQTQPTSPRNKNINSPVKPMKPLIREPSVVNQAARRSRMFANNTPLPDLKPV